MSTSRRVRIWATRTNVSAKTKKKSYIVRWIVEGEEHSRNFAGSALADNLGGSRRGQPLLMGQITRIRGTSTHDTPNGGHRTGHHGGMVVTFSSDDELSNPHRPLFRWPKRLVQSHARNRVASIVSRAGRS
jgi:hypothetical protein